MDLQSRKIEFIQEFLKLQDEDAVERFESLMRKEKLENNEKDFKPMTKEELNERIDQSENNFKNNKYKPTKDLLSKYK